MTKSKPTFFRVAFVSCVVHAAVVFGPFLFPPDRDSIILALMILFLISLLSSVGFGFASLVRQEPKRWQAITVIVLTLSFSAFLFLRDVYEHDIA
jgi:heme/copper-type cytochrome/quinol oxidase subunit 3